jgi:ketosteroid isomerase-like protein
MVYSETGASGHDRDHALSGIVLLRHLYAVISRAERKRGALLSSGMAETEVELTRQLYRAYGKPEALDLIHPDISWRLASDAATRRGHEGVIASLREWHQSFERYELVLEEAIEMNGLVFAISRNRIRGRGSGLEMEQRLYHLLWWHDGLLVRLEGYSNRTEAESEARRSGEGDTGTPTHDA